jgi:hypothetical protein
MLLILKENRTYLSVNGHALMALARPRYPRFRHAPIRAQSARMSAALAHPAARGRPPVMGRRLDRGPASA